ncbi:sugar ABC transporter ATP-binding protein [Pleurocapsa sp. CCALA 161]|uniref:ABC transporter ATP-binding protein n=1 Tax=Pleurocapsa sp. CCALA 161 TaxID=2107688 RepID=UPI000D080266|nr:sn-glycerol-3-phosphate ABC transporter ATP-binding protein UgpC [Pleurocapsa sp. CCALA 161]PSB09610.1 sugar ABC transporter ATP-binding protein [Pleurocapsa sp. CCALA 161]
MAKLKLQNLQKKYRADVIPVKDISLEIDDGEFLTLLGPSGCGKSTLLRLIAGLEAPTRGEVSIGGQNVNQTAPGDRNMAMVFQSYALYPHMTAAENIATALKIRKMPEAEIKRRVNEAAHKLELTSLLNRKPGQMSGGQRQRVALARALVRNPEVFLLDEPLSNLDALLREQVRAQMKQLFKEQNKPVVYVTHDQTEAMTLSTKVAVLNQGMIQQLDPPSRIYSHPANEFVASFVGSPQMNLLTLRCENDKAFLGKNQLKLPAMSQKAAQIVLGIRPEDVLIATGESETTIVGQVYLVEQLGKDNLVSVRINGSEITIRALLPSDTEWQDQTIPLAIQPQKIHWFDVETGDRL